MHMASAFFIHHGVQQTNTHRWLLIYNIKAPHVCMMWLTIAIKLLDINNFQRKLNGTLWPKNKIDINGFKHVYEKISCREVIASYYGFFHVLLIHIVYLRIHFTNKTINWWNMLQWREKYASIHCINFMVNGIALKWAPTHQPSPWLEWNVCFAYLMGTF